MAGIALDLPDLGGIGDGLLHEFDLILHKLYDSGSFSGSGCREFHRNVIKFYISSKYIYKNGGVAKALKRKGLIDFT